MKKERFYNTDSPIIKTVKNKIETEKITAKLGKIKSIWPK